MQTTVLNLVNPLWFRNLEATIEKVVGNQEDTNKILEDIRKIIEKSDLESTVIHNIQNGVCIKRRLQRIKILIGNFTGPNSYEDVIKEWEGCVQNSLNMTKRELLRSIDLQKRDKSIFDVMDEIPEYRKIGVDILVALERKYKIPPALYSVEQVRQISFFRYLFDHTVIKCMNEQEFISWIHDRQREMNEMYEDCGENYEWDYGRYKLYWIFAMFHPELIPEQQMKYMTKQELMNIVNRAINDNDVKFYAKCGKYFPLSDRKYDTKLLKDQMKKIFIALSLTGFILALGTAGVSDMEQEMNQQLMTNRQFYIQIVMSFGLLFIGGIGTLIISNKQSNERVKSCGTIRLQKVSNHGTARNTYDTRSKAAHESLKKRSAS